MTVRELIADLQENFQDYMDLEVRIGTTGQGNYLACKPDTKCFSFHLSTNLCCLQHLVNPMGRGLVWYGTHL